MSIKYQNVSVSLISKKDDLDEVWKISRPHLHIDKVDSSEIKHMGLPINGFISYSLKITSSILFRDLLLTVRPIIPWAMSNRTFKYDFDNMFISGEIGFLKNDNHIEKVKKDFISVIEHVMNGEKQDQQKIFLPLLTSTTFCVQLDYRTLINFIRTLEIHFKDYFLVHGFKMLEACEISLKEYNNQNKSDLFSYYALTDEELVYSDKGEYKRLGSIHMISANIYANLMAQFIRQHSAKIKNELYNMLENTFEQTLSSQCHLGVSVVAYIDDTSFKHLISTRTCWFAQMDKDNQSSWAYILGSFVKTMTPKEFMNSLPCKGNHKNCKILGDMIPRIQRKEVNLPCPILLQDPSLIGRRIKEYESDSEIMVKWKRIQNEIELDLDNIYLLEYLNGEN